MAISAEVTVAHSLEDKGFKLETIPPPASNDAATAATFTLVDGLADPNSADLSVLHDGRVPSDADAPSQNFFFQSGTTSGRLQVDLGKPISVKAVHTYSWHTGARAPQHYKLYAASGEEKGFSPAPGKGIDPRSQGWKPIVKVDTRGKEKQGGQHAAEVTNFSSLDLYRYLLFEIEPAESNNPQSTTFFSEIDIIDTKGPAPLGVPAKLVRSYPSPDQKYTYVVDATAAPDLMKWVESDLIPMVNVWYPKMAAMLPSEKYQVPATFQLSFKEDMPKGIPAYAQGNKLSISIPFCRGQLQGEAKGCVIHEMVHVVQNYWIAGDNNKHPTETPTWVGEGIADYVRWFLYEPESKGAEITKGNFAQAKHDSSYRISANFIDWVIRTQDKDFLQKLNAAAREGRYSEKIWKDATSKSLEDLGKEWKASNAKLLGL